jgi:hypothetical protein
MSRAMLTRLPVALLGAALAVALAACQEEEYMDHTPPEGQGSLVVDNNSTDTLRVLVNATTNLIESGAYAVADLAPGDYDVRVEEQGNAYRTFEDLVTVHGSELLILHVFGHPTDRTAYTVVDERR